MKLYIDLGAHTGKTTETWLVQNPDGAAYAFEPNPACLRHARWGHIRDHFPNATVIEAAAWIEETTIELWRPSSRLNSQSCTVLKGKLTGDVTYQTPISVRAIDFPRWLDKLAGPHDDVTLKMDIEGAEYEVLEKMIAEGTIHLVDRLTVEFHAHKFEDPRLRAMDAVIRRHLKRIGLPVTIAEH